MGGRDKIGHSYLWTISFNLKVKRALRRSGKAKKGGQKPRICSRNPGAKIKGK